MGFTAIFGPIGLPEMVIILIIIVLIFGASRLPEIGRGFGKGIKNFKEGLKDGAADEEAQKQPPPYEPSQKRP